VRSSSRLLFRLRKLIPATSYNTHFRADARCYIFPLFFFRHFWADARRFYHCLPQFRCQTRECTHTHTHTHTLVRSLSLPPSISRGVRGVSWGQGDEQYRCQTRTRAHTLARLFSLSRALALSLSRSLALSLSRSLPYSFSQTVIGINWVLEGRYRLRALKNVERSPDSPCNAPTKDVSVARVARLLHVFFHFFYM